MAYLLDSDVFIQAKNLHYGFDFCPGFWEWLVEQNRAGKVYSIEKVGTELEAGNDELAIWAAQGGEALFLRPEPAVLSAMSLVSAWATGQSYEASEINTFMQGADYYLVAHALALGYTVVTHEVPAPFAKRIKIPNACVGLGVKCMNPFEMLRLERARFVLG